MTQDGVYEGGPVEARDDREPPRDCGWLEAADFLHPSDVELQARPPGSQRIQVPFGAPGHEAAEVGPGMVAGRAGETGQVGGYGTVERAGCQGFVVGRRQVLGHDVP